MQRRTGHGTQNSPNHYVVTQDQSVRHTSMKVFEQLTVASADLRDPEQAPHEIDRVLAAIRRLQTAATSSCPRDRVATLGRVRSAAPLTP